MFALEPTPDTVATLTIEGGPSGLTMELTTLAEQAQTLVPDLVGVSIGRLTGSLVFTLVATDLGTAALDAVQYLSGGPCAEGALTGTTTSFEAGSELDGRRWPTFAAAAAVASVRSTSTLPLSPSRWRAGTVNLFGAIAHSFDDHQEELAQVFGAWAGEAVSGTDLGFSTFAEPRATPDRLRCERTLARASELLAARLDLQVDGARAHLYDAAARADVPVVMLARLLIGMHVHDDVAHEPSRRM